MSLGPLVIGAGLFLLVRIDAGGDYVTQVLPAVVVFGLGLAINVAPLTSTAMNAAPAEHAGIASAVNNDVARIAGLLAVAVLPVIAGITGDAYLYPDVLLSGFREAVLISGVLCLAGGLLAALTIKNPTGGAGPPRPYDREMHCALGAPPLRGEHHALQARSMTSANTDGGRPGSGGPHLDARRDSWLGRRKASGSTIVGTARCRRCCWCSRLRRGSSTR